MMSSISERVADFLKTIPETVTLCGAAKTKSAEEVSESIRAGLSCIGMNYLQELKSLRPIVKEQARWHFIGHLQSKKVKDVCALADLIETIDREKLLLKVQNWAEANKCVYPVLIEVNSAEEEQKSGVMPDETLSFIKNASIYKNVEIRGLMTMGPALADPEELRPYFRKTKALFDSLKSFSQDNLKPEILSMGMSDSFQVAIEEGSTEIRLGSRLYGARDYSQ